MKVDIYIPDKINCIASKKLIMARAGIPFSAQNDQSYIKEKVNKIYQECFSIFKPRIFYKNLDIKKIPLSIIPASFTNVSKITIFISTIGKSLDNYLEKLYSENKIFEALIADACGSESIEALNRHFDSLLNNKVSRNCKTSLKRTRRFSPGYQDIDVKINRLIYEKYFKNIDIKILKSGQIIPRKSTICLIGWCI